MKTLKWEPLAAMLALILLGAWIAFAPDVPQKKPDDATRVTLTIGAVKGALQWQPTPDGQRTFTVLFRDNTSIGPLTQAQAEAFLGRNALGRITTAGNNDLFRILKVSGWIGVAWVVFGIAGQIVFGGRWLLQWFVSEKTKSSTVPVAFWWLSLVGSIMLFAYFVWRQDIVGTLGQTSGVVIFARNIRLIAKQRRRLARTQNAADDPQPAPDPLPPDATGTDAVPPSRPGL
ncbi:MAG: lipid-A-disaccharide synthase N-terminal domain-containing protein [bacterium]